MQLESSVAWQRDADLSDLVLFFPGAEDDRSRQIGR